ncbi:hypothetical protein PSTT_16296 [Puccinia striiformis]|uniref:Ubiquitin carboxyl-terminal hydrolase n=1 Tax=Puccinia striiformis TaxID=27350 RepID=A0A2S4UDP6_9BASI|nr:hypothetical protein PSTT_16296 [Puccinia striiformis]
MSEGWSLTESDPAIFSILLNELGVSGLQVDELWSLDNESLGQLKPVHALIFLFKYVASDRRDGSSKAGHPQPGPSGTWFAHQVRVPQPDYKQQNKKLKNQSGYLWEIVSQTITNACATLAILNAVMNVPTGGGSGIELGPELSQIKEFSVGVTIHSLIHSTDEPKQISHEDAYHFITYLPISGSLYELDGLNALPVFHGKIPDGQSWTNLAREVIQAESNTYSSTEVHFNLMAICEDRVKVLEKRMEGLSKDSMGYVNLKAEIEAEESKRTRWTEEVSIKRHNHIGLIHALMVGLARHGKLADQVKIAKLKMVDRQNQAGGMEID